MSLQNYIIIIIYYIIISKSPSPIRKTDNSWVKNGKEKAETVVTHLTVLAPNVSVPPNVKYPDGRWRNPKYNLKLQNTYFPLSPAYYATHSADLRGGLSQTLIK